MVSHSKLKREKESLLAISSRCPVGVQVQASLLLLAGYANDQQELSLHKHARAMDTAKVVIREFGIFLSPLISSPFKSSQLALVHAKSAY